MSETYDVTGMSCAACQLHVEKAVSKVPGVTSCNVSLLTNSMKVEGTADPEQIEKAVEEAGYGAALRGGAASKAGASETLRQQEEALRDKETPVMRRRLITSAVFLAALMYISMGYMMWGWPLPPILANPVAAAVSEMLLAVIVMMINRKFFINGFGAVRHGTTNMDTLVALGSAASFAYSLAVLYMMIRAMTEGDGGTVMSLAMTHLYFESAAMILTMITIGKLLEALSKGRTTDALKGLMRLAPKTAVLLRGEEETEVPVDEVRIGDIFVVRPGAAIPVDGVILEGETAIDESALTGESIPVDKGPGDEVSAATINSSGFIRCRASRVGEDTTLSQIIQMVSDAAATKAPLARIADKVAGVFVPVVIGIAVLTCAGWMLVGREFGWAFARGISVLVISCPCALGLATPVAVMVGSGMGAKHGILYKTAASLEAAGRLQMVALDKTGTITNGSPVVTDIWTADGAGEEGLLQAAVSLEAGSEHPLAGAIMAYGREKHIAPHRAENFQAHSGSGLTAEVDGKTLFGGNRAFMQEHAEISGVAGDKAHALAEEGKTPMFFAADGHLLGIIAVADTLKEDSRQAVAELKKQGIRVVMLTGDNAVTARAIGLQAGVDQVIAGVLPSGKETVIRRLQKLGKVAMVGDGINDAPALTRADVGIAIGAGADVALDAADIVLMKSRLGDVPAAIRMSRATIRNIHQNLFWAFFYNLLCIPLAAGLYGIAMKPMYGAAAMACSSVFVCMNALRLNLFNMHDTSADRRMKNMVPAADIEEIAGGDIRQISGSSETGARPEHGRTEENHFQEDKRMTKTVNIKGMMCEHCEMTVKKALEKLEGVESAAVSHEKGTAVLTLSHEVPEEEIKKAVEDKDYEFVSMS